MSEPEFESECPIQKPGNILESFNEMFGFVQIPHPPISDKLYDGFLLPIEYLEKSQQTNIPKNVADDLELIQLVDVSFEDKSSLVTSPFGSPRTPTLSRDSEFAELSQRTTPPNPLSLCSRSGVLANTDRKPMYEYFAEPSNDFGKLLIPEMAKRYTTNIGFLEDTQKVVERTASNDVHPPLLSKENTERFIEVWKEIKEDKSFLDRHSYMEYIFLEDLNKSRPFLNAYSIMNLISPIYSLVLPLILMLMPFVLLKIWNVPITFDIYLQTLRDISKTHFIGRILNIREWNLENGLYILFIGGMYIMQTYAQITSCIKYHAAIKRMNENLMFMCDYLNTVIGSMGHFVKTNADLPFYSDFCQDVHSHKLVLQALREKIGCSLTPYGLTLKKVTELGHMFDCYYQLYSCMDFEASLRYSVGFEGYMDILRGVARGYKNGFLGQTKFHSSSSSPPLNVEDPESSSICSNKSEKDDTSISDDASATDPKSKCINKFHNQYYPPHKYHSNRVQNTVDLATNIIITGVNASGKTTTLKSTALNILFSQQFGFGFYESADLTPYNHIHSYLNIPDTSGRDSLFQAESRRCKEILDKIRDAPEEETHFTIFDELYSGTNPTEAAKSAHSLLNYLSKKTNVRFILTTHYVNVCRKFRKSNVVKNYKMNVETDETGNFIYTYKMGKGISTLEGGIAILKTMNYPAEIINTIQNENT